MSVRKVTIEEKQIKEISAKVFAAALIALADMHAKFHIDFHFVIADFLAHLQLEHQMAVSSAACLEFLGCYV